jgi:hypothetical protein
MYRSEERFEVVYNLYSLKNREYVRLKVLVDEAGPSRSEHGDVSGPARTGTRGKPTTCSASFSRAIPTSGACTCRMNSNTSRSGRISRQWAFPIHSPSPGDRAHARPFLRRFEKSRILSALEDQDTTVVLDDPLENEMILNMGPQHPATHGVLRLLVRLDGETVVAVVPELGYLHRGTRRSPRRARIMNSSRTRTVSTIFPRLPTTSPTVLRLRSWPGSKSRSARNTSVSSSARCPASHPTSWPREAWPWMSVR